MRLRDAIRDFPTRQINRLQIPRINLVKDACARFQAVQVQTEEFAARLERILASVRTGRAAQLNRRDVRFATAAIGNSDLVGENEVNQLLGEIERRRSASLHQAIFGAFLASYRNETLRLRIKSFLQRHVSLLRPQIQQFCDYSGALGNDENLRRFAGELAKCEDAVPFCLSKRINSNILASNYGTELKTAAIRQAVQSGDENLIGRFLDWAFSTVSGTPIGEYYEAMLAPFGNVTPQPGIQRIIVSKAVERFQDPRIYSWPSLRGSDGPSRKDICLATIKRWLSIEYLDLFIRIIESTAVDRQFRSRKAFWLKYFESDKISDVTLILASDADRAARRAREPGGKYGIYAVVKTERRIIGSVSTPDAVRGFNYCRMES